MCGIGGIFGGHYNREARRSLTARMLRCLAHRGPDGEGLHAEAGWSLAHRRLAIIAPEEGAQPMWSEDGRYCLAYNGEIYNYIELRQQIAAEGDCFATNTDAEVLLRILIRYGMAGLKHCSGMFAFAFYDSKEQVLLLARDHCGIKPLYYTPLPGQGLAFASEIKALLCNPDTPAAVEEQCLDEYLIFQFCLGQKTLFRNIFKLLPGHALYWTQKSGSRLVRWHEEDYSLDTCHNEQYFIDALRFHLEKTVDRQLRSDVPVGAYLSGGLDSSIITTLATRRRRPFACFTGFFSEAPAYDERHYAKAVCAATGADLFTVEPTEKDFVEWMPSIIHAMDEPVAGPGAFPQFLVSRLASNHVKVCLGGQGADEIFGGYARYLVAYLEQALKGAIFETHTEGNFVVTLESIIPNLPVLRQYVPMLKQFWREGLFDSADRRYFTLINRASDVLPLLAEERRHSLPLDSIFLRYAQVFNASGSKSSINRMLYFDQQTLLPALLQLEDRASMHSGLESRVPFLDPEIMRLAASIPPTVKLNGGKLKNALRLAADDLLPTEVSQRKDKMGFPVPLEIWITRSPVREFVSDLLLSKRSLERGVYTQRALEAMISGTKNGSNRALWGALCLEMWHRTFIDGAQ